MAQNETKKLLTLCLIHQHPRVLLGMKKRGFGAGRWNGFGGKLQEGESIEEAAKRELREEVGLSVDDLNKRGIIEFRFSNKPGTVLEVHVFKISDFTGEPMESEEMKPEWFHIDEIPFSQMWKGDVYWMPLFFKGSEFKAKFLFDENDNVLDKEVIALG